MPSGCGIFNGRRGSNLLLSERAPFGETVYEGVPNAHSSLNERGDRAWFWNDPLFALILSCSKRTTQCDTPGSISMQRKLLKFHPHNIRSHSSGNCWSTLGAQVSKLELNIVSSSQIVRVCSLSIAISQSAICDIAQPTAPIV